MLYNRYRNIFARQMKLISVTILFICLLTATFSNWILIAAFDVNQKFIAEQFCINKNSPGNHCNGHCFLNRQLCNEERSGAPLKAAKEKFEIQLFCAGTETNINTNTISIPSSYTAFQHFVKQQVLQKHFHPPCIA